MTTMSKKDMKVYKGARDTSVTVCPETGDSYSLPYRLDLWNHSPTGFNWGYGGSGPSQLALALLADHLGNDQVAVKLHQQFKWQVIARLPIDEPWEISSQEIDAWLGIQLPLPLG